ncbi:helix-turn-helix domain-containing protein [Ethanoligenens sp.]|uniref:helix-turn-helix domain-containing protein n=1 Tax=Ethanoligenens sp. TaxID=2099655 RepID=UPI0039E754A0
MNINEVLQQRNMTKYQLSKNAGVPFATISDITTGKARIEKCAAGTLYKLSKALGVTMEDLVVDCMEYRQSFETFKSNVCHRVKDIGDMDFIIETLESDKIRQMYQRGWYPESLYLLAMVDYLSRENGLPACAEYSDIRSAKLRQPIYPASVIAMSVLSRSDKPKRESYANAIPEFRRFNIVESEVRDVC